MRCTAWRARAIVLGGLVAAAIYTAAALGLDASFRPRRLHPSGSLRTRTPEAGRASHHARPSASSIGTARRVKQDPGGTIERPEYTLTLPPNCPRKWGHLRCLTKSRLTKPT